MADTTLTYQRALELPVEELRRLIAEGEKTLKAVYEVCPYLTYVPNPSQYRWLQMLQKGLDEGKMKFGVFDGNSSGKTLWLVQLIWAIMCPPESRSPWFNVPFITNWKWGKHIRLVCKGDDMKDMSGMIWQLIDKWWPKTEYTTAKQDRPFNSLYTHKTTKFYMDVRTFDQPVESHDDGSTIAFLPVNEPPPTAVWNAYPPRLREGGFMLATATLVRESRFFKDDVIDNPNAAYSMGDIEGNCFEHATLDVINPLNGKPITLRGTLHHENLEAIIKNSPAHEQEARRTGRPVHLSGAALPIIAATHFVPRSVLPDLKDATSILALDPHERRPWALMVLLKDGFDKFYVVDEWPKITTAPWKSPYHKIANANVGYEVYVSAIRQLKARWRIKDGNCVIDSKFAAKTLTGDQCAQKLRELLQTRFKLRFVSGATAVRGENGGINTLTSALNFDSSQPVGFGNQAHFFVADDLWNTKYQLENITWDEMADAGRYGESETLDEKFLDFPRLAMYGLMHKPSRGLRPEPSSDAEAIDELETASLKKTWEKVRTEFPPAEEPVPEPDFESESLYV